MATTKLSTCGRRSLAAAHRLPGSGPEGTLHGHTFHVWAGLTGPLDPDTGLAVDSERFERWLDESVAPFDYSDLNQALPSETPDAAGLAREIWARAAALAPAGLKAAGVEVRQEAGPGASLGGHGLIEIAEGLFSAAHRTDAPGLSGAENVAMFGICNNPAGHGHNYRVEAFGAGLPDEAAAAWRSLDHRNLSADIAELAGRNVVTEAIAEVIASRLGGRAVVRVWELPDFYAEYAPASRTFRLGRERDFGAAHWLAPAGLTAARAAQNYGPCARGRHGHTYRLRVVVEGKPDPRAETAYDLVALDTAIGRALEGVAQADLSEPSGPLASRPATVENTAACVWERLQNQLGPALVEASLAMSGIRLCHLRRANVAD